MVRSKIIYTVIIFYLVLSGFTCRKPGLLVLTFDDGISQNYIPLLQILDQEKVKATFFVVGRTLNKYNLGILKEVYNRGHTIGNHTWNHYRLDRLTNENIENEVLATQDKINLITPIDYPKYIRPPYGAINKKAYDKLKEHGYNIVRWNMDARDWNRKRSKSRLLTYYENVFKISNPMEISFISLQHDRRADSIEIIPDIVRLAKAKGFKIVSLDECLGRNTLINRTVSLP